MPVGTPVEGGSGGGVPLVSVLGNLWFWAERARSQIADSTNACDNAPEIRSATETGEPDT